MDQVIVFDDGIGGVGVVVPIPGCGLSINEIMVKDAPAGALIVDVSSIPSVRTFRNSWEIKDGVVTEQIDRARAIAHDRRRGARSLEFAPLDRKIIIPGEEVEAEEERVKIREKYAMMQENMDAAPDVGALRALVGDL